MRTPLLAITVAVGLAGCADNPTDLTRNVWESNPAGAKGLLRGGELRYVQISQIVNSFVSADAARGLTAGGITGSPPASGPQTDAQEEAELDQAIAGFYSAYGPKDPRAGFLRNEIEDRLIAASNQRCGLWENYLLTSTSNVGFWSGLFGTAANAASIAFSPVSTKNALTALSTTATDVGTEFNKAYLYGETTQVIVQGVETRRSQIAASIRTRELTPSGNITSIQVYSLSAAIGDALSYHAACSMASGLQEASETLADQRPPATTTGNTTVTAGHAKKTKTAPAVTTFKATASPTTVPLY